MSTPDPNVHSSQLDPHAGADAKLEAEISEALGDLSIDEIMDMSAPKTPAPKAPRAEGSSRPSGGGRGKPSSSRPGRTAPKPERVRKTGTVMRIHGDDVFVEFGPKSQGVCPLVQFGNEAPALGAKMEFILERFDAFDELYVLSREGAVQKANWSNLEVGQVVEARCIGMNKGGLEMEIAHHKAFMPAGQVDVRHIADISIYLGQKFPCQVVELNRDKDRIVLSRKAVLEEERSRLREEILAVLEVGQQRTVTISSIQPYGAFADLGGVDGLIHVSDISYDRIKHPKDVLKEGQQVDVKVLRIDRTQNPPKISLGMKQCMADPSVTAFNSLQVGETITGRVTKIMPFGAFVEVGPGFEGLVHISEISHERIPTVDKALSQDQIVTARILGVDPDKKRVSLSIKATIERPAPPPRAERQGDGGGRGGKPGRGDRREREMEFTREEDHEFRKLKARFGSDTSKLKGGLG